MLMISLLCWLGGRRVPIDRADFRHVRAPLSDDRLLWGYNLTFGAEPAPKSSSPASYLRLAVVQDLASLKVFLRSAPQWLVIRFRNQDGLATQVSPTPAWQPLQPMADAGRILALELAP